MFGAKNKSTLAMTSQTIIAEGVTLRGDIDSPSGLVIHGEVEGNIIRSSEVIIGQSGLIKGHVEASSVTLAGNLEGMITATDSVHLESSAVLLGDIQSTTISIEPGATIVGRVVTARKSETTDSSTTTESPSDSNEDIDTAVEATEQTTDNT